ncbi:MAG TPA: cupin domain-containing protein [Acidobacteriota bacterium]|nr:cupin domain-containing protein [Acidobacteriota bacterium]
MQGPPSRAVSFDSAGGVELVELWATDETPEVPRENGDPVLEMASFTPGLNGSRFRLVKFPPATEGAELDAQAVLQEVEEKAPGEWNFEEDAPGMHTTDTVDYGVVISGEISLVLDDGAALSLKQGDCVVQNGTRHAWNNTGSEPCWMAFVMIGAQRRS